jgi:hypothetical protein
MSKPILAAIDPLGEDVAPAALGLLLARLTSAPLVLATAYPVDVYVDSPPRRRVRRGPYPRELRPPWTERRGADGRSPRWGARRARQRRRDLRDQGRGTAWSVFDA